MIKKLAEIVELAKSKSTIRKIAVAAAGNQEVLEALKNAVENGIVEPVLIGDAEVIRSISKTIDFDISNFEIIDTVDNVEASAKAVKLIKKGRPKS